MQDCTSGILIARKLLHPRVKIIRESLFQLSPAILPRDAEQPKQGSLLQIRQQRPENVVEAFQPVEAKKPQTFLTLNSSLLQRRRKVSD